MRLKRRGLIQGYIKVPEKSKNGKQHLHVLIRGEYIAQAMLSEWWLEIHKAKIVDIRRVGGKRTKTQMAGYMAKYLSKENAFRYSWSWGWVWRGFCRDWTNLKKFVRDEGLVEESKILRAMLWLWHLWLKLGRDGGLKYLSKYGYFEI